MATIRHAIHLLGDNPALSLVKISSLYETEPVGMAPQHTTQTANHNHATPKEEAPWFVNAVVAVDTTLSAPELLAFCLSIENQAGRIRPYPLQETLATNDKDKNHHPQTALPPKAANGYLSRTLDLDILFYGDHVYQESNLVIPHPRLHERAFVLTPLVELAPDWVHPQCHQTIQALHVALKEPETVRLLEGVERPAGSL